MHLETAANLCPNQYQASNFIAVSIFELGSIECVHMTSSNSQIQN